MLPFVVSWEYNACWADAADSSPPNLVGRKDD